METLYAMRITKISSPAIVYLCDTCIVMSVGMEWESLQHDSKADLHGTTLSHATSLRQSYDMKVLRVNQTYNSLTTVVYVNKIVVGF